MKKKLVVYLLSLTMFLTLYSGCAKKQAIQGDGDAVHFDESVTQETPARGTAGDGYFEVYKARDEVLDYFRPVQGTVETVENGFVQVRLRDDGTARKGMRLSVFREGDPFYHPVTGELIGNAEEFAGRIAVQKERDDNGMYLCRVLDGELRTGDNVRISSSKIPIAFFQDRKANWGISEAFYSSLKDSDRFLIGEAYASDYNPETLSKLARGLEAEAALMFSTIIKDGKRKMNIKLYWASDGELFGEVEEDAQHSVNIAASEEDFIISTFSDKEPWRNFTLPGGELISMGDVDGNGIDEFVVSDGRNIRVYALEEEFLELWKIETEGTGSHISLDVLDLNGNGRAEIFVTSVVNAQNINLSDSINIDNSTTADFNVSSFVLEYDAAKGYERVREGMPYFFRVSGTTLLMQRFGRNRIFSGPVYEGKWENTDYRPDVPLELPGNVNIYGFTYVDWENDGTVDLAAFGNDGFLYLYDGNGNLKWKSETSFGPFAYTFETRTQSAINPTFQWSAKGRLEVIQTDRGSEVIILSRKPVLSKVPGLGTQGANIYSLWWNGSVMEEELVLSRLAGAVTDYWLQGRELFVIARGSLFKLLGSIAKGDIARNSVVYYYSFAPLEASN